MYASSDPDDVYTHPLENRQIQISIELSSSNVLFSPLVHTNHFLPRTAFQPNSISHQILTHVHAIVVSITIYILDDSIYIHPTTTFSNYQASFPMPAQRLLFMDGLGCISQISRREIEMKDSVLNNVCCATENAMANFSLKGNGLGAILVPISILLSCGYSRRRVSRNGNRNIMHRFQRCQCKPQKCKRQIQRSSTSRKVRVPLTKAAVFLFERPAPHY